MIFGGSEIRIINYYKCIDSVKKVIDEYCMIIPTYDEQCTTTQIYENWSALSVRYHIVLDIILCCGYVHFNVYNDSDSHCDNLINLIVSNIGCTCYVIRHNNEIDYKVHGYTYAKQFDIVPNDNTSLKVYSKFDHKYLMHLTKIHDGGWYVYDLEFDNVDQAIDFIQSVYGEKLYLNKKKLL